MDKKRIKELVVFGIIFAIYNMLVWVIPFKRTGVFVIMYIFALISIICFAASYFIAFDRSKTLKSKFLSFPIFRIGLIYMAVQLSVSTVFMILSSFIPIYGWIALIPCVLILTFVIIKTVTIDIAREKIEDIAIQEKANTFFIRTLHVGLDALSNRVSEETLKLKLSRLSEAVRYSDPVSNNALSEIEARMQTVFGEIKSAIYAGRLDVEPQVDELNNLLLERNMMCKITKLM